MRKLVQTAVAGALAAATLGVGGAGAAVVFSDNFNSYALKLDWTPPPALWTVPAGSVDLIGETTSGTDFDFYPGNGGYVDLDGSTQTAGTLETASTFAAGSYTLTFDLGGNARGNGSKTTVITLGSFTKSITLPSNAGLDVFTYKFYTTGGKLSFADLSGGNNNIGNILDDVSLSTGVPEPVTWALMLLGVAGIGASLRRVRSGAITAVA
jgi:hypothetical protein